MPIAKVESATQKGPKLLPRTSKRKTSQHKNEASRDRIARLFLLLDDKLALLEARHQQGSEPLSSTDNEKDARTMISLIRVYEKLLEMQAQSEDRAGAADSGAGGVGSNEAQSICRELAGRIERLQQQSKAQATARKPRRD